MKSRFEEMGGTYKQVGDTLIPNLVLPDTEEHRLGKYGRMRRTFLQENRPILYNDMILTGTLFNHLVEIDESCRARMEILCKTMAEREGVTEALKADDPLEWVRRMNSVHDRAEERVLRELIYDI